MCRCRRCAGDGRSWRGHFQPLVGDIPAVIAAAVLTPAVAAAAVRPPARESISLIDLVAAILVAKAIVAASVFVVVATSAPMAPSAAATRAVATPRAVAAPHAATAASPLLPGLTPGGPVGDSLILAALVPSAFGVSSVVRTRDRRRRRSLAAVAAAAAHRRLIAHLLD
jgi:hypothetical protein